MYELKPEKEIRELDLNNLLIGKEVEIKFGTYKKGNGFTNPDSQQVSFDLQYGDDPEKYQKFHIWGWTPRNGVIGEEKAGETEMWKVKNAFFLIHSNGGRSYRPDRPKTYWEFFNDEQKNRYNAQISGGLMGRVMGGMAGDMDRADIRVEFENGVYIEDSLWEVTYPEEWNCEVHKDNNKFKFVDGYYENADKAIEAFKQKSSDDMFGERYFPIIVFGKEVEHNVITGIVHQPKSHSAPILMDDGTVIFGTRCKPYEYEGVIIETYAAGGKVPIGMQWDWGN